MRYRPALILALCLAAPLATPIAAQNANANRSADENAVLAVINRLFDAMRAGDSAAVRAVFQPGAQVGSVGARGLTLDSVDEFVRSVGTPHAEVWDEKTWNERVFVDGNLAVVWTDYAFYAGANFSHCGVDAFQLVKGADGWKIFALADTRRREGCTPPPLQKR